MTVLDHTTIELSYQQLCTLRWALEANWREMTAHQAAYVHQRNENPDDADHWTAAVERAAERIAAIDAIVAQFPESIREDWAKDRALDRARMEASAA